MDSALWHRFCNSRELEEPVPLSRQEWKSLSDKDRRSHVIQLRRWFAQIYIDTDELKALARSLNHIVQNNEETPPGAKDIAIITGPYLAGKSTFTKRWAKSKYLEWTADSQRDARGRPVWRPAVGTENDRYPVVWINLQPGAQKSALDSQFLHFVNLLGAFSAREMTNAVVRAVLRHRVRALIIDDVHLMKTDLKRGREVLDHVKHLNTELGEYNASLILVGAELAGSTLAVDPQIRGRLKLITFPRYSVNEIDGQRSWQRILRDLETRISPHLSSAKDGMLYRRLAGELWDRTGGSLGSLKELVTKATLEAIDDGSHKILHRHIDGVILNASAEDRKNVRKSSQGPRQETKTDPPAPVRSRTMRNSGRSLPRAM